MDYNVIFLVVGTLVAITGIIVTNIWNNKQRKDRLDEKRSLQQAEVERTAREKQKDEQQLAKEVAKENKVLALEVKQDMKDHVDRLIVVLKQDIELQRTQTYSKLDSLDNKVAQVKIDLMEHIEREKDERIRMQRSIDFFQTMQFGPDAKSIPAYVTGEEEKAGHEDEPYKGVFASREDTTHKDTKDPAGVQEIKGEFIEGGDKPKETKEEQDKDAETESEATTATREKEE